MKNKQGKLEISGTEQEAQLDILPATYPQLAINQFPGKREVRAAGSIRNLILGFQF